MYEQGDMLTLLRTKYLEVALQNDLRKLTHNLSW